MFLFKVLNFVAVVVLAASQAQFPAGVDPALCPGFPICDNARLHDPKAAAVPIHDNPLWNAHAVAAPNHQGLQPEWNSAPQQQQPQQWNANPQPQWNQQQQWNANNQQQQWNANNQQQQWNANNQQPQQWSQFNHAPAHVQQTFSQWNSPQPQTYTPLTDNHITTGGDKYPAGISPQSCPNYPYCDINSGAGSASIQREPLPGYNERQYPAGVNPSQCPDFPYCS